MTDLIARLEKRLDYHIGHDEKDCTETVTLADFRAVLHALKVTEAAEAWERAYTGYMRGMGDHAADQLDGAEDALAAAVKGEQG